MDHCWKRLPGAGAVPHADSATAALHGQAGPAPLPLKNTSDPRRGADC